MIRNWSLWTVFCYDIESSNWMVIFFTTREILEFRYSELSSNCKSKFRIFKKGNGISTMGILQDQTAISQDCAPQTDNISQKETLQLLEWSKQRRKAGRDGSYSQRHLKIRQFLWGNHLMLSFCDGWVSLLLHSHHSSASSTLRNWLMEDRAAIVHT